MSVVLGSTQDPSVLVPGDPRQVYATAGNMRSYRDALHLAARGLKGIDAGGWSGSAADAFWGAFEGQPKQWLIAGDCFDDAARALTAYASTLTWAQGQAGEAIWSWSQGEAATRLAEARHAVAEQAAGTPLPFVDPGAELRAAAQDMLASARRQLAEAGDDAARTVERAGDLAPQLPTLWDRVGAVAQDVWAGVRNGAGAVANAVLSFGHAVVDHPQADLGLVLGAAGMALGAGGEVGGVALDATGIGAVAGVPAAVVSAGAIATGAATMTAGMGVLMSAAAGEDAVHPVDTEHTGAPDDTYHPTQGFRGSDFSQDEIEQFVNGHTGDGMFSDERPTEAEVQMALDKGVPQKMYDESGNERNAEEFIYGNTKVMVNYDIPWRSTAVKLDRR